MMVNARSAILRPISNIEVSKTNAKRDPIDTATIPQVASLYRTYFLGQNMKQTLAAIALICTTLPAFAGGMADAEIEAPVIEAAAESSALSANGVMAIMIISVLLAALDN